MAKTGEDKSAKKAKKGSSSSNKNTARVVKIEKKTESIKADSKLDKKPRVRKVETVRERNQKAAIKAELRTKKTPKRRVRRTASKIAKPFKKPAQIISWPFRTRPVRFIGRILGRIFWPMYFRNSWKEIRLVKWPSRKDTWKLTFAVIIFALIFGLAASGVDWVLDWVVRRIVFRA